MNVTDAVWPFAAAVTVAVVGAAALTVAGGLYVVMCPCRVDSEPGPVSVQAVSKESEVMSVGPPMVWFPEGEIFSSVTCFAQPMPRSRVAASVRVRMIGPLATEVRAHLILEREGFLSEYVSIIFCYQFRGKESEQVNDYEGKGHPVEASIDRYARYSAYDG